MADITVNGNILPKGHRLNEAFALMTRTDTVGATACHTMERHFGVKYSAETVTDETGQTLVNFGIDDSEYRRLIGLLKVDDDAEIVIRDNGKDARPRKTTFAGLKAICEKTLEVLPILLYAESLGTDISAHLTRESTDDSTMTRKSGKSEEVLDFSK